MCVEWEGGGKGMKVSKGRIDKGRGEVIGGGGEGEGRSQ